MSVTRSDLDPWVGGPFELLEQGEAHLRVGSDKGRRFALTAFDNSIEVAIGTFAALSPSQRRGIVLPREQADKGKSRNFHERIEFLQWFVDSQNVTLDIPISRILWYHSLRNDLYHSGNGVTPELKHVEAAHAAALAVFEALFDVDPRAPLSSSAGTDIGALVAPKDAARDSDVESTNVPVVVPSRASAAEPTDHGSTILWGDSLASQAHRVARELDPLRKGLSLASIERGLVADGLTIRGEKPYSVLSSAINRAQNLFTRVGRGVWRWDEPSPIEGIAWIELEIAAFHIAQSLDPNHSGLHYETIKASLVDAGTKIRGPNPGQTLVTALRRGRLFTPFQDGIYDWVEDPV